MYAEIFNGEKKALIYPGLFKAVWFTNLLMPICRTVKGLWMSPLRVHLYILRFTAAFGIEGSLDQALSLEHQCSFLQKHVTSWRIDMDWGNGPPYFPRSLATLLNKFRGVKKLNLSNTHRVLPKIWEISHFWADARIVLLFYTTASLRFTNLIRQVCSQFLSTYHAVWLLTLQMYSKTLFWKPVHSSSWELRKKGQKTSSSLLCKMWDWHLVIGWT